MASVLARTVTPRSAVRPGSPGRAREGKSQPRIDAATQAWVTLDAARVAEAQALMDLSTAQERVRRATEAVAAAWREWNRARGEVR